MSQNAGALTPSRGNRRFILLALVLGLMGAGLVYVATSGGSSSTGGGSAANTPVVVAKADIPARTVITASMVEVKLVPAGDAAALAYGSVNQVVGQATRFPIVAGEQVLSSKVVALNPTSAAVGRSLSFVIPEGKRGFSISASEVQDAGGLVLPGDYVDIVVLYDVEFANKAGDSSSRQKVDNYVVQTIMQNVEVLAVSQTVVDVVEAPGSSGSGTATVDATPAASSGASQPQSGQRVRNSEAKPEPGAATVTLSLTPDEAQRLYLAEANGRIRLAVRPYGDDKTTPVDYQTKLELIPQNLPNPFQALR